VRTSENDVAVKPRVPISAAALRTILALLSLANQFSSLTMTVGIVHTLPTMTVIIIHWRDNHAND